MEQDTFKNVNNCLNTNIHSYLETSGTVFTTIHFIRNLQISPMS